MRRRFHQVDVFGAGPFSGNPLAVVLDGEGLTTEQMQSLARWTNLSETTFILPSTTADADYRVRIFTLARELPFAGHPTLGSCHAWLSGSDVRRDQDVFIQECEAGLVNVRRNGGRLAFAAPPLLRYGPVSDALVDPLAVVVGLEREQIVDTHWIDNGPGRVGLLLWDAETVLQVEPDFGRYTGGGSLDIGLVGPYPQGSECAFELRALFSDDQGKMREDPVTGSLNASVAQWLFATERVGGPYVASQGTRLGRKGRAHITRDSDGTIWVGGQIVSYITGELDI